MSVSAIILAAVVVGGTGIVIGIILGIAGEKFKVEVDPKEEEVLAALPGNNCGGCGFAGCSGLAAAIAKGEAEVGSCPVGGAPVAAKIGAIMGQEVGESVREVAFVKCAGTCENANTDYEYYGVEDCSMMAFVPNGGPKKCNFGCLGFGECVKACPKNLIELVPYDAKHAVQCSSQDKGKQVMTACKVGCIGCKMCERVCESGAVTVENNIAHIDQTKCTGCGACAEKCPKKIITGRKVTA